jgi:ATP/maltotriose-dependent transcriptional regulator MalT/DNA-binding MarR family transcriptional regulator
VSKKKFRLTVQEQIIVHLFSFKDFDDLLLEVPFGVTQEGVANAIGVVRSAIPRAMKRLIEKKYVNESVAHITALTRRRKVYFLTLEGLVEARRLVENLQKINVKMKNIENKDEDTEIKLDEVNKILNTDFKLLDILNNMSSDYCIDVEKLLSHSKLSTPEFIKEEPELPKEFDPIQEMKTKTDVQDEQPKNFIHYTSKTPKPLYFVGRENELSSIIQWLGERINRMIIVHGIAGIGKTTLISKVIMGSKLKGNVFWYRFHEWDNLRNVLCPISEFLSLINKNDLKDYIETNPTIDLNDAANILETELDNTNSILFFDDFHKIEENDSIVGLFRLLTEMLERISGVKFVIASRSLVHFYDRREVVVKKLIIEMPLKGLDEAGSKELLKLRNVKDIEQKTAFDLIYKLTQGHPLSLELIDELESFIKLKDEKNINLYIEEEIFLKLSDEEKKILQVASLHRYPTELDGLLIYTDLTYDVLSKLSKKSLLEKTSEGYEAHEIVKDFFFSHLSPKQKKVFHSKIGDYYRTLIDTSYHILDKCRAAIETIHHQFEAGDLKTVIEIAIQTGQILIDQGYYEELHNIINNIDTKKLDRTYLIDLLPLKGDINRILGDNQKALELYREALDLPAIEKDENITKLSELHRKIGHVHEKLDEWDTAIKHYNKSLDLSEKCGDLKGITDAYGGLGWVYWKKQDYDLANKYYDKCMRKAELMEDLPGKAKIYMGLGITSAQQGNLEDAIKFYEKCISVLERNEDVYKIARMYDNLGDHYLKTIFSYYVNK